MALAYLANRIWLTTQWKEYKAFLRDMKCIESRQQYMLHSYIRGNKETKFGKAHHFNKIHSYSDFQKKVPIQSWDQIGPWVTDIEMGEYNILTHEKILAFEETSGTTSFSKLIPYSSLLKKEFQRAVATWICGMYQSYPKAFNGPSYWSISPATKEVRRTEAGIPIGMESDEEYFGFFTRLLLKQILAIPPNIGRIKDAKAFYFQTFLHLAQSPQLSLLSVWSPTFLLQMDRFLQDHQTELHHYIETHLAAKSSTQGVFLEKLKGNFTWKELWPNLQLVSCWTDAQAALWLPSLRERLGSIDIQPKGLLSTEGVSSIPIHPDFDPVLALRSHFFEFREVNSQKVYQAHELQKGGRYEIILTTGGGLYRYASGDLVQITGFIHEAPCFRFMGRLNAQSDLVGEKLAETHFIQAVTKLPPTLLENVNCLFFMPIVQTNQPPFYAGYLELNVQSEVSSSDLLAQSKEILNSELEKNPYYAQAIRLGQLAPLRLCILDNGYAERLRLHLTSHKNIKDGDLKIPLLFTPKSLKGLELPTSFV